MNFKDAQTKADRDAIIDAGIRKFKKLVQREGILDEVRKREFFVKKPLKRKLKAEAARLKK